QALVGDDDAAGIASAPARQLDERRPGGIIGVRMSDSCWSQGQLLRDEERKGIVPGCCGSHRSRHQESPALQTARCRTELIEKLGEVAESIRNAYVDGCGAEGPDSEVARDRRSDFRYEQQ